MNNFTKTEALPKSGHVNEVCKEWLVREDGALAYKLQSQEITDFYKGNRFRNAVVREDFPTALHEQIKEKENAEKQFEAYRRRLIEQEEHDKSVAKEIADKLERDLQEQQQREYLESEQIAQQMQEIYVNLPPAPPPAARERSKPPPRPAKASILQQNINEPSSSSSTGDGRYYQHHNHQQQPQQQQQSQPLQQFSESDGYVGLSLPAHLLADMSATPQRQKTQQQQLVVSDKSPLQQQQHHHHQQQQQQHQEAFNQFVERSKIGRAPHALTNDNIIMQQQQQYRQQHLQSSTSTAAAAASTSSAMRRNVFELIDGSTAHQIPQSPNSPNSPKLNTSTTHTTTTTSPTSPLTQSLHPFVDELIEYSDVADSIRRYDIANDAPDSPLHSNINRMRSPSNENLLRPDQKFQKLSPEKYDQLVGNDLVLAANVSAAAERHMQQHADDIELYVDPCDYASLKEIGLPMEEIKEMSKKLKQEQKDELLARRLQEMEANDGLTQEARDRLMAIEAQDKELAKMLQEREKAKAKRAKEKARQRKSQQKDTSTTSSLCATSGGLHCGPLLPLPHDCMSMSSTASAAAANRQHSSPAYMAAANTNHDEALPIDVEAYSNPIDLIQSQRTQNGTLTNGSLTREGTTSSGRHANMSNRDDDIYTLPVDSCRPGQRPASLNVGPENGHLVQQHNSMTRSENYSAESHDTLNGHELSVSRMNYSKSGNFDQNSSPTPPYMPIQGTRRSNSSEDRKKKSKDKCTHQ